ncbi:MotA/TolQ/ExbB proton channel family protein [Hydrogenophaga sp. OTU3427]|uniref:MotA/TolQ/ExbB proton channel family protein n=1 Tax=Hydrogenophaga sp. OTU3427 TaxID=3043856 RepID=UPI00313E3F32
MSALQLLAQADPLGRAVALLLLAMSVGSWVVLLWKFWLLRRAAADLALGVSVFWQSPSLSEALPRLQQLDREAVLAPLVRAAHQVDTARHAADTPTTLAASADVAHQLTRVLRQALHAVLNRLRAGQVLLASVGATAPFVGLLGTVWGIFNALTGIADQGQVSIAQVSGPVGEALVMTAAGLAVAIPAVLAYNVLGRRIARIEADLEGFARDLRDLVAEAAN